MKLAEALILRADLQKRLEQLKQRLLNNAKVQEGDAPAEDPHRLLEEVAQICEQLELLIRRINKTNSQTAYSDGKTLTDALAERDVLHLKRNLYVELAQAASITQARYSKSEVRYLSTVNVTELQREIDGMGRRYRELETKLQELNWTTELLEA